MVIDPNSQSNGINQYPNYTNVNSALEKSELFLAAIANFLSVIWLYFVAIWIAAVTAFFSSQVALQSVNCVSDSQFTNSCDKYQVINFIIQITGGLLALITLSIASGRGWRAYHNVNKAEKI